MFIGKMKIIIFIMIFPIYAFSFVPVPAVINILDDVYKASSFAYKVGKEEFIEILIKNPYAIKSFSALSKYDRMKLYMKISKVPMTKQTYYLSRFNKIKGGDKLLIDAVKNNKNLDDVLANVSKVTKTPKGHRSLRTNGKKVNLHQKKPQKQQKNKKEKRKQDRKRQKTIISIASWNLNNISLNSNDEKIRYLNKYIYNLFTIQKADLLFLQEIRDSQGSHLFGQIDDNKLSSKICNLDNSLLSGTDNEESKQLRFKTAGFLRCVSKPIGENRHKERYVILLHPLLLKKLKRFGIKTIIPRTIQLRGFNSFKRPAFGIVFGKDLIVLNVHLGHYGNNQESINSRKQEAQALRKRISNLMNRYKVKNIIIAGDFNLDKKDLQRIFKSYKNKKFYISTPNKTTNKNSYDHVISTLPFYSDIVSNATTVLNSGVRISDHKPIRVKVKLEHKSKNKKK